MIGAIIITHGRLAGCLIDTASAITGKADNIKAIHIEGSNTTDSVRAALMTAVKEINTGDGVIIFTDMFGGTPTNIALPFCSAGKVEVITGVNLPMLFKFIGHRADMPLAALAVFLRDSGRQSIVLAGDMLKDKK